MNNIELKLSVRRNDGCYDWQSAIDEAHELSKKLDVCCSVNYIDQHVFRISPDMSQDDIEKLKNAKIVIGL